MKLADITPERAVTAVFFSIIDEGDYVYLNDGDFADEDPDEVRRDFDDAIEHTLTELGVSINPASLSEAEGLVLENLPALAEFLKEAEGA